MGKNWDFSGWATKANIRCSDGRTILKDAFKDCDGMTVPLVWNHRHNDPSEVLGHALLENRDDGVYAYCSFNESEKGQEAKECVRHGDITQLSIFANNLKQSSSKPPCDVIHGMIREVSLVLAGANIGAFIDNVMTHGEPDLEEAVVYHGEDDGLILNHADEDEEPESDDDETIEDILNTLSDKQKAAVGELLNQLTHSDESDTEETDKSEEEAEEEETPEEEAEEAETPEEEVEPDNNEKSDEENENEMKHNVFDTTDNNEMTLSHSDMEQIFKDAKRLGSLKEAIEENLADGVLSHAVTDHAGNTVTYGIADIDYLFPDAKSLNNPPEFIKRDMDWVSKVINGTHHTPFSRVKSMFADITMDEARAKGFTKGNIKTEEVFTLLKRDTSPQTIYKKQKLDRDDILDITDFNVVAWIKGEMRMMLEEEIARAILIGDGRSGGSNDKIKEANVRPVYNDADLYTVKVPVEVASNATEADKAEALMDAILRARKLYKGSGNPTFFTTEDALTEMLLMKDGVGHRFYKTDAEVATALRAKEVVTVEPMEGQKIGITVSNVTTQYDLAGVLVNLADYNIGADKGGQTTMFEDFDIDYNREVYLLETRISGALIKPYSAISFYYKEVE